MSITTGWCKILFFSGVFLGAVFGGVFPDTYPVQAATTKELVPPPDHSDKGTGEEPGAADDRGPLIPLPDSLIIPPTDTDRQGQDNDPAASAGKANDVELPNIERDVSKLPLPVAHMRELIMKAARAGDIEALRPLIGSGSNITVLSLGGIEGDPIEFIKSLSGDADGQEILAILLEVLEAPYVHMDAGQESELFVWPYFFALPLEKLTPKQKVELFRIVTAGDYEDMQAFGSYIFYRVGITPEGRWQFFVAGD